MVMILRQAPGSRTWSLEDALVYACPSLIYTRAARFLLLKILHFQANSTFNCDAGIEACLRITRSSLGQTRIFSSKRSPEPQCSTSKVLSEPKHIRGPGTKKTVFRVFLHIDETARPIIEWRARGLGSNGHVTFSANSRSTVRTIIQPRRKEVKGIPHNRFRYRAVVSKRAPEKIKTCSTDRFVIE